jgi:hypothetical protein
MRYQVQAGAVLAALAVVAPGAGLARGEAGQNTPSSYAFLQSVSCPAQVMCMAVGAYVTARHQTRALAERWNGTSWSIVRTKNLGSHDELWSVSCASASSCSAVGDARSQSVPMAEEWNGAVWALVPAPLPPNGRDATLQSVSCAGPKSCVAAGSMDNHSAVPPKTLIEHWNGLRWSVEPSPNPPGAVDSALWGISCPARTSCTAVGDSASTATTQTTLVERGSGSSWTIVPSPGVTGSQTMIDAVDCRSVSGCTAVGTRYHDRSGTFTATPLAARESRGTWRVEATPHPAGTTYDGLGGVACVSVASCLAVGSAMSPSAISTLAESRTGGAWAIVPSPDAPGSLSAFGSISCLSLSDCLAVGDNDNGTGRRLTFSELWNGKAWTILRTPDP